MSTAPDKQPDGVAGTLVDTSAAMQISVCSSCSRRWFPPRSVCSACNSDQMEQVEASRYGVAYASTVVRIGPAGFDAPYVLSYVDLDGVRVLAHTDVLDPSNPQPLPPNTPVTISRGQIGHGGDGTPFLSYRARAANRSEDLR